MPICITSDMLYRQFKTADNIAYTEFEIDISRSLGRYGRDKINRASTNIAQQIAHLLESQGNQTQVIDHILSSGFKIPLFGPDADRIYVTLERFQTIRNSAIESIF